MHMPSKEYRQRLIEELVEKEFISTQAEIAEHLARRGIKVTQATISRDVNELRLVRLPAGPGQHRYRSTPLAAQEDVIGELSQRFRLFVRDLDRGDNLLVINTDEGHASGIAYVIDKLDRDEIVGTLAGQNTILVVARSVEAAVESARRVRDAADLTPCSAPAHAPPNCHSCGRLQGSHRSRASVTGIPGGAPCCVARSFSLLIALVSWAAAVDVVVHPFRSQDPVVGVAVAERIASSLADAVVLGPEVAPMLVAPVVVPGGFLNPLVVAPDGAFDLSGVALLAGGIGVPAVVSGVLAIEADGLRLDLVAAIDGALRSATVRAPMGDLDLLVARAAPRVAWWVGATALAPRPLDLAGEDQAPARARALIGAGFTSEALELLEGLTDPHPSDALLRDDLRAALAGTADGDPALAAMAALSASDPEVPGRAFARWRAEGGPRSRTCGRAPGLAASSATTRSRIARSRPRRRRTPSGAPRRPPTASPRRWTPTTPMRSRRRGRTWWACSTRANPPRCWRPPSPPARWTTTRSRTSCSRP
jgi:transcriptional regulator of arginine metabolism